ncbi:SpoIIE family protein phosphatase [Sinomonas sp. JGH33]|uniref:SpoIIE family protein phosphatase n=1 Tax=Sinomonas terricola TaxID=3110330 RepID=A0ABU5T990_9MICC|nr:SpoIIE family protein phosphatase [Sinomonas sp. JGH33]MEA5456011.1 SpoIIE family protein phosphatase [Sinomonas sp. JGH33]
MLGHGARRALIVEDSADVAILLSAVLSGEGFVTEGAASGHRALEAARELKPDLITLDLGLPDIDGLEVCRALRLFTDAYILVISGSADEATRLASLEAGADGFLGKPVNPRELKARAEAMLRRPRAEPVPATELETAARVQRGLLPQRSPVLEGYDVAGACRPSRSVGGDFFDWQSDGHVMDVTLADAMGKGMGAALIAATARAVLRAGIGEPPVALVGHAAAALEPDLERISSFITLLYLQLDGATGAVDYVDAGHGLGMLVHPGGGWERLVTGGPPLGLVPESTWSGATLSMEPGSTVVVMSDGVLDSFGGLEEALSAVASVVQGAGGAQDAVDRLLDLAREAEDDVTAVVFSRCA